MSGIPGFWRRLGRRALIIPPIAIGVVVLTLMVRNRKPPERREVPEAARALRVIPAPAATLLPRAVGYGTAQPGDVWSAVAEVKGQVVQTHQELNPGAILRAGDVVLQIDPTEYELQIAGQQADIAQTKSKQAELEAQEKNLRASLEIEDSSLKLALQDLARLQGLRESNSVTEAEYERKQREVLTQRQSAQSLNNSLNVLPAQREALVASLAAQEAALARARLDLERCVIRAPIDCRLSEVTLETGQVLTAGQQLFQAYGIAVTEIEAQIAINQMRPLLTSNGQPLDMTSGAMKAIRKVFNVKAVVRLQTGDMEIEWQGRFDRVREQLDLQTRTARIVVAVDDPFEQAIPGQRPPLTPGMFCEVELSGAPRTGQIMVPRTAVHDGHIYVLDSEDRLRRRPVSVGVTQDSVAVIDDGLAEGERVVVSNPTPAIEGMLVKPITDDELLQSLVAEASGTPLESQDDRQ